MNGADRPISALTMPANLAAPDPGAPAGGFTGGSDGGLAGVAICLPDAIGTEIYDASTCEPSLGVGTRRDAFGQTTIHATGRPELATLWSEPAAGDNPFRFPPQVDCVDALNGDTGGHCSQRTYDEQGRILSETEMLGTTCIQRDYTYTAVTGRLRSATFDVDCNGSPDETYTYGYDINGNRTCARDDGTMCADGVPAGVVIDGQDRLLHADGVNYTYDAVGTLTSRRDGVFLDCYDYNVFGTLERYERWIDVDAGGTCFAMTAPDVLIARVTYRNDPYGRRIERVAEVARPGDAPDVQVTRWAYADALNPIAELDESGEVRVRYVYATHAYSPDAIIEYPEDGGEPVYHQVLHDPRGSIRGWISLERQHPTSRVFTRTLHEHAEYDPWGLRSDWVPVAQQAAGTTRPRELTSLGFAGGIYDPITGLVRFGARDYDPRIGRWTAKDPIGFAGGDTLLYGYVGGDPVNGVDPTGLQEVHVGPVQVRSPSGMLDWLVPQGVRSPFEESLHAEHVAPFEAWDLPSDVLVEFRSSCIAAQNYQSLPAGQCTAGESCDIVEICDADPCMTMSGESGFCGVCAGERVGTQVGCDVLIVCAYGPDPSEPPLACGCADLDNAVPVIRQ